MRVVTKNRASAILYTILKSNPSEGKWILPANCCSIVPLTFLKAKTSFELLDIENEKLGLSKESFFCKAETNMANYAGLIYVDTYGVKNNLSDFFIRIKQKYPGLIIVHDKCLSIPSLETDPNADITLYSTGYSKYVDLQKGGYAILNDSISYQEVSVQQFKENDLKDLERAYKSAFKGEIKFRYDDTDWLDLSDLNLASDAYFNKIEQERESVAVQKKKMNEIFNNELPEGVKLKDEFQNWRYHILVNEKELLLKEIFNIGMFASSHYNSLGNLFNIKAFYLTELLHSAIINLFNDFNVNESYAISISKLIRKHCTVYGEFRNDNLLKIMHVYE